MRLSVSLALLICCAVARIARADSDGGASPGCGAATAAPEVTPSEPQTAPAAGDSGGGGLFEQSNAAAAAPQRRRGPAAARLPDRSR